MASQASEGENWNRPYCVRLKEKTVVSLWGFPYWGYIQIHIYSPLKWARTSRSWTTPGQMQKKKNRSYLSNEKYEYPNIGRINRSIVLQEQQWPAQHKTYHILINNYKKGGQGQQTQSHDKDVRICIALVNQYTLCMCADKSHYCSHFYI